MKNKKCNSIPRLFRQHSSLAGDFQEHSPCHWVDFDSTCNIAIQCQEVLAGIKRSNNTAGIDCHNTASVRPIQHVTACQPACALFEGDTNWRTEYALVPLGGIILGVIKQITIFPEQKCTTNPEQGIGFGGSSKTHYRQLRLISSPDPALEVFERRNDSGEFTEVTRKTFHRPSVRLGELTRVAGTVEDDKFNPELATSVAQECLSPFQPTWIPRIGGTVTVVVHLDQSYIGEVVPGVVGPDAIITPAIHDFIYVLGV